MPPERAIRLRASAAIVRDGHILLVEYEDEQLAHHYNLPGGGVEPGEPVRDAVRREVREETTAVVEVGPLLLVWEFRSEQDEQAPPDLHVVDLVFRCALAEGSEPRFPPTPDLWQTGVRWVPLGELLRVPLLPRIAGRLIAALEEPPVDRFVADTAVHAP